MGNLKSEICEELKIKRERWKKMKEKLGRIKWVSKIGNEKLTSEIC